MWTAIEELLIARIWRDTRASFRAHVILARDRPLGLTCAEAGTINVRSSPWLVLELHRCLWVTVELAVGRANLVDVLGDLGRVTARSELVDSRLLLLPLLIG